MENEYEYMIDFLLKKNENYVGIRSQLDHIIRLLMKEQNQNIS